jgi:DNA-binding CsgD family transcriptional regulator/tetratricopeptide (TPR) repeat protein
MRLVERERQLEALSDCLEEIRARSGAVALVSGEAGAGKSVLVSAFLADLAVRVAAGWCDGLSTPRPLGPLIEIAAQLEVDTALSRDELFRAILAALTEQPTIVLIEDLHWVDDATADFLLYVGRRLDSVPAMLIATYRDDEIRSNVRLTRLVGELTRLGVARRVAVCSLTESGVASVVAGSGLDAPEVFAQTSGNPFFVAECLAAGSSKPGTVGDVVLGRAARLSAAGRRVLDIASQLGVRFESDVLIETSGVDADGIDNCIEQGMLVTLGADLGFRHELSRLTIAEQIPPIRLAALNRGILQTLQQRRGVDVARLARHAADANEAERASRYGLDAARRAAQLGSHGQALVHYRTAIRFASSWPINERASLLDALAAECMVTDQMGEALAAAEEALRLWRDVADPLKIGAAHVALSYIAWYLGQGDMSHEHASQAVAVLGPHAPTVELARALVCAGGFEVEIGDRHQGIRTLRRALDMARVVGDPQAESNALNTIGWALGYQSDVDDGVAYLQRALKVALAHDLGHLAGRAYANLAQVLADNYRFSQADGVIAEGLRYTEDRDLTLRTVCLTSVLATSAMERGRWDDAMADAIGMQEQAGTMTVGRVPALTVIGTIKMRRGDPDGETVLEDAMRLARRTDEMQRIVPVALALGERAWLHGDLTIARQWINSVLDRTDAPLTAPHRGQVTSWAVRLGDRHKVPPGTPHPLAEQINGRWQEAADAWRALDRPYEQALALIEIGTPGALTQSFAILDGLNARPASALVAERLRALGARVPRGRRLSTRTNPAGLTPREAEVLQLLARGLTNAEIAAALFLSDKTIEHHVSNVLSKLGVSSRRDAARMAPELDLAPP